MKTAAEVFADMTEEMRRSRAAADPDWERKEAAAAERFMLTERRNERAANLSRSGVLVTDEMRAAIVRGELTETHALRTAMRWLDVLEGKRQARSDPGRILVLSGGIGTGKTVAAAAAVARFGGLHMHSGLFADLVTSKAWQERQKLEHVLAARLVVLDDVGAELDRDRARAGLQAFVDHRQGAALSILTTNLTEAALQDFLDPRTSSRLAQVGIVVECKGDDMRRRKAAE